MTRRLLESLSGEGTIHAGGRLLRTTSYRLSVWAEDAAAGDERNAPAIEGHVDITGIGEAVVLAGPEDLILTLGDGRRLAFTLTSSTGVISGVRWLPPA